MAIWRLAARRGVANWRLLATLTLGVVVASTLLASAPIYARAMADLGVTFTIRDELRAAPSTRIEFRNIALQTADGQTTRAAIEGRISERIGWFRADQSRSLRLGRFTVLKQGEEYAPRLPLGQPQSLTGYETHVRVLEGRLPVAVGPGEPMQVAISTRTAQVTGLKPAMPFTLVEDFDTCERELPRDDRPPPPPCTPRAALRFTVTAVVTAIIEPLRADDPFWLNGTSGYFEPVRLIPEAGPIVPLLADEATLLTAFGSRYPGYRADTAWHVFADPERLTRANVSRARDDLRALYREFEPLGGYAFSPLTNTLERFQRGAEYQETPLTILLLQIAGIALFYVGLVSAIVVERQADEIALLRGRGASVAQIVAVYALEGAIIAVPVALLAPFLAAATTALLGLTPTFRDASAGEPLPVTVLPAAFGLAAVGALLSVVALIVPALVVARRGAMAHRRAQGRPGSGLIQRYYLDLVLVALAGLLLWELNERGSVFTPSATGGVASDPVLLASPALIMVAAAAVILRFYPLVLRIAARLASVGAGVSVAVGLWNVVRRPGQYTRLALLVMMAVAVGTFAASYSSTAERSYRDRARYETGVDLRAGSTGDIGLPGDGPRVDAAAAELPGVQRASSLLRTTARLATVGTSTRELQVLAVDPAAVPAMLWFRADFATRPLDALMAELAGPSMLRGKPLSGEPRTLSVWVDPTEPRENVTLWARVRDRGGQHALLEFGKLDFTGWRQMTTTVQESFGPRLEPPLTLVSIVMTGPASVSNAIVSPIYLDDITAVDANGLSAIVEDFEGSVEWAALPVRQQTQDNFTVSGERTHGGRAAGRFAFRRGPSDGVRGIYVQDRIVPLPALVSASFVASTGLGPGSTTLIQVSDALIPISIKDQFSLFPTLDAAEGPSIILNRDQFVSWSNAFVDSGIRRVNEVWFTLQPGADRDALSRTLSSSQYRLGAVLDSERALRSVEQNPLISAGGGGILLVAFVSVLTLVGAALLLSLWIGVQRRRVEFAVMRSLGVSRGQVFRMLALEYALVVVVGLVVGAYLGLSVGRRMLSFLNVTETGVRVVPPFILQTNWGVVVTGVTAVLLLFAAALLLAVRVIASTTDAQALRGE